MIEQMAALSTVSVGRFLAADADFMIKGLFKYTLFGKELYITTTHVAIFIVDILILILAIAARKKVKNAKEVPDGFQNVIELIVEFIDKFVKGVMGENAKRFANYIGSIFIFIILCNISSLIGLRPPTADYGVTLPLGLITFFLVQINGIRKNKLQHFGDMCKPVLLTPINIIGELAVPLSLSLRLFGNILSGTVMMGLIYGLLPIFLKLGLPAVLHVYFDLFSGAIQTYVFCMLTMVYVTDKIGTTK